MAKKPETLFKEKVQRELNRLPNVWHIKTQMVSLRGVPDIVMCVNGYFMAWELKVDSPIDELQKYVLDKVNFNGGYAVIVSPKNFEIELEKVRQIAFLEHSIHPGFAL